MWQRLNARMIMSLSTARNEFFIRWIIAENLNTNSNKTYGEKRNLTVVPWMSLSLRLRNSSSCLRLLSSSVKSSSSTSGFLRMHDRNMASSSTWCCTASHGLHRCHLSLFFSERVIDVWNGLSDSIGKFKSSINSLSFFSDYLEFNWLG